MRECVSEREGERESERESDREVRESLRVAQGHLMSAADVTPRWSRAIDSCSVVPAGSQILFQLSRDTYAGRPASVSRNCQLQTLTDGLYPSVSVWMTVAKFILVLQL